MEDSVAREVALRLKVAAYEARYGSHGNDASSSHARSSRSVSVFDQSSNQSASLGLMSRHRPQPPFPSSYRGGGSGFAPGGLGVLNDNMEGYRHQVRGTQSAKKLSSLCLALSFFLAPPVCRRFCSTNKRCKRVLPKLLRTCLSFVCEASACSLHSSTCVHVHGVRYSCKPSHNTTPARSPSCRSIWNKSGSCGGSPRAC